MEKLNFAILGAGNIAETMARTISKMPEVNLYAIASRDKARASDFATKHRFQKAYASYEEMVQDDKVQLVYIATPHSHHFKHASLCLNNGKAVLCEKTFTANAAQAQALIDLAHEKNLLLVEAVWTRFLPLAKTIKEIVASGAIGKPEVLTANFGQNLRHVQRMIKPELAGGALLDLGIYPLTFADIAFGHDIAKISAIAQMHETGVDEQETISLLYKDGRMANIMSSMKVTLSNTGRIYGSEGKIEVSGVTNYEFVRVVDLDGVQKEFYPRPAQITGYEYEVRACIKALQDEEIECPEMPHAETLRMLKVMDEIRGIFGLRYPFE